MEGPAIVVDRRVVVEQMDLGDPRGLDERGLGTDANRGQASGAVRKDGDPAVDPVRGQHGSLQIQVRGGNADRSSPLVARNDRSHKGVDATEQTPRILDPTEPQKSPHDRTPYRDLEPVGEHDVTLRNDLAHPIRRLQKVAKGLDGTGPLTPEPKIGPDRDDLGSLPQAIHQKIEERVGFELEQGTIGLQLHDPIGAGV